MTEDSRDRLTLHLSVALACLRGPLVRAFAGRGRSRRRELDLAPTMASNIAGSVAEAMTFERDGTPVIWTRIAATIEAQLRVLPEHQARNWAGANSVQSEAARKEIAALLSDRLATEFSVRARNRPVVTPATQVWCGAADAKSRTSE